jgi:hypothetical protein
MPRARYYGDTGLFRMALDEAGFEHAAARTIFNDDSKAKPKRNTRRLKLWFATEVFDAPQKQQRKLEKVLRELFGDRILAMYFARNSTPYGWPSGGAKSLCIKLQDF